MDGRGIDDWMGILYPVGKLDAWYREGKGRKGVVELMDGRK